MTTALVRSLDLAIEGSEWFDVPGPETLSGQRESWNGRRPHSARGSRSLIEVPFLSPQLSSHWVRFVTRAEGRPRSGRGVEDRPVAHDARFWGLIGHAPLLTLESGGTPGHRGRTAERSGTRGMGRHRTPARGDAPSRGHIVTPAGEPMVLSPARQDLTAVAMVLLWALGAWESSTSTGSGLRLA